MKKEGCFVRELKTKMLGIGKGCVSLFGLFLIAIIDFPLSLSLHEVASLLKLHTCAHKLMSTMNSTDRGGILPAVALL